MVLKRKFLSLALLDVSGGHQLLFIALDKRLSKGELSLRFTLNGGTVEVDLGPIDTRAGGLIGVLDRMQDDIGGRGWRLRGRTGEGPISLEVASERLVTDLQLLLGKSAILTGRSEHGSRKKWRPIRWEDSAGVLLSTRGHPLQNGDDLVSSANGVLGIAMQSTDGAVTTVQTRLYHLSEIELPRVTAEITPIVN